MTNLNRLSAILACTLMIGVVGCKPKPIAAPSGEPKAADGPLLAPPQQPSAPAAPQAESGDTTDPAKVKANLASLSTEDRALAEKQKICPVSGEALGTMGAPKKISVAGHDVFICCQGCEKELTGEPEKYLAKLGLQPAK
jgi:YHS domain-containing protein